MSPNNRERTVALLLLSGLVLALFESAVFRGLVLFDRDIYAYWYGQTETFVRCLAAGSWPVWDPSVGFGQPFLANPGVQAFYPWTWLNLVLSPGTSYTVYTVSHLVLSGMGFFLLARRLDVSFQGALLGAVVWTTSGPFLSMVSLWHHFAGAAWIPWVFLAADYALSAPSLRSSSWWAAAQAAQALAGSAEMCVMTALALGAYLSVRIPWRSSARRGNLQRLGVGVLVVALVVAMTAAQWAPSLDYFLSSDRAKLLPQGTSTYWSVHPFNMLQLFLPTSLHRLPLTPASRAVLFEGREPFLYSLYLGLSTLALAAAGLAAAGLGAGRRRLVALLFIVFLVACGVSLGRFGPFYDLMVGLVPPLRSLRYPAKAMIVAAFLWAVLVAVGFDSWRHSRTSLRSSRWAMGASIGAFALGWASVLATGPLARRWAGRFLNELPEVSVADMLAESRWQLLAAAIFCSLAAGLILHRGRRSASSVAPALLVLVCAADLFVAHRCLNPTAAWDLFWSRPAILQGVEAGARIFRFDYQGLAGRTYRRRVGLHTFPDDPLLMALTYRTYPTPWMAKLWGVHGSFELDDLHLFPQYLQGMDMVLRLAEETPGFLRVLQMGSVEHVIALHSEGLEDLVPEVVVAGPFPERIRRYRVPSPFPRAYLVATSRVADRGAAINLMGDREFDPAREVILTSGTATSQGASPVGESRILERRPDRIRVETDLRTPGYLVFVETFDEGWRATIDGAHAPVVRANLAFQAVAISAGKHVVELAYRPRSVLVGLTISALGLLAFAVLALRVRS